MSSTRKLPADYAIDALSIKAQRRAKKMGRPDYSYGKLVADTTQEERERIVDSYLADNRKRKNRGCTHSFFSESDNGSGG